MKTIRIRIYGSGSKAEIIASLQDFINVFQKEDEVVLNQTLKGRDVDYYENATTRVELAEGDE